MYKIGELAWQVTQEMTAAGYSPVTIWRTYAESLIPVVRYHKKHGEDCLNQELMADYIRAIKARRSNGSFSRKHSSFLIDGANKMLRFSETGKISWAIPVNVTSLELDDYYKNVLEAYITEQGLHPNTRKDVLWVSRKFFSWLLENECPCLKNVDANHIQNFIIHCAGYMKSSSVYDVQLYMRKLCAYLFEEGLINNPFTALLSMKIQRDSKLYPPTPHDELVLILEQIDRTDARGKRNYAIIMLGAILGLRAVDIIRLKLPDIDWQAGEIKIVQAKTGSSLALPLTADVGGAVRDYILYARPKTTESYIFLRSNAPYLPISDASSVGDVYDNYCKKAGLPRKAFDGKGFHSLRRSLGKNMVTAGVAINAASQVLGQENPNSAEKYIALDSEHLKECALDFTGVALPALRANGGDGNE